MTPQIQQGFIAPIVAAAAIPAAGPRSMGGDLLTDIAAPLDGSGQGFLKMVQDGVVQTPDAKAITGPTAAQSTEVGSTAAVAMLLNAVTKAATRPMVALDENLAVSPPDQNDETDLGLRIDPANGAAFLMPIPMPQVFQGQKLDAQQDLNPDLAKHEFTKAQILTAPIEKLSVDVGMPVDDRRKGPAPSVPDQTLSILPNTNLAQSVVPQGPTKDIAISDPLRATNTNSADIALPSPTSGSATLPAVMFNSGRPAANMASVLPQNTENLVKAPIVPSGETAKIPLVVPLETHVPPALTSSAETVFRLRTLGGEIHRSDDAPIGPVPVTDSKASKSSPLSVKKPAPIFATEPSLETAVSTDTGALPAVDLVAEQPFATVTFSASDLIKQAAPSFSQPSAATNASVVLPPQVPADLVNLAKTLPTGPVEILLNPQELGQLRFEIHQNADHLRVVLSVERPETMDLLRRNTDQLLAEFRAAGFSGASLSFGQWDQQNSDPRAPLAPPPPVQDREKDPPPSRKPLHSPLEMAASTGLNMRL